MMTDKIIIDGYPIERLQKLLYSGQKMAISTKTLEAALEQLAHKTEECEKLKDELYFTNESLKDFEEHFNKAEQKLQAEQQKTKKLEETLSGKTFCCTNCEKLTREIEELKAELSKPITFPAPEPEIINLTEKYKQALKDTKTLIKAAIDPEQTPEIEDSLAVLYEAIDKINEVLANE